MPLYDVSCAVAAFKLTLTSSPKVNLDCIAACKSLPPYSVKPSPAVVAPFVIIYNVPLEALQTLGSPLTIALNS